MDITSNEVSITAMRTVLPVSPEAANNEGIWLSSTGWPQYDYWSMKRFSDDESYEEGEGWVGGWNSVFFGSFAFFKQTFMFKR
jgi:hypothetical protein